MRWQGIACLRLGEQQNCIESHNPDSCLMPIAGRGVDAFHEGPRAAVEAYGKLLALNPADLGARWLLNLAHQTLGTFPAGVPDSLRISPEIFKSEADFPRFIDVAPALGLDTLSLVGGAILEDFNGDDLLDAVASSWGIRDPLRHFQNNGDGSFVERTDEAGLLSALGGLNVSQADYDNDGDQDIFAELGGFWPADAYQNALFLNPGSKNRWIDLRLEGTTANRSAVGARIVLFAGEALDAAFHLKQGTATAVLRTRTPISFATVPSHHVLGEQ